LVPTIADQRIAEGIGAYPNAAALASIEPGAPSAAAAVGLWLPSNVEDICSTVL
jgi:hypothetical protein